jgi:hypothetical protein
VDPWSDYPVDRMRYLIYTRRLGVEAMKTRALLFAAVGHEKTNEAMTEYMEMAVPYDKQAVEAEMRKKEIMAKRFAEGAPIKAGSIRVASLAAHAEREHNLVEAQAEGGNKGRHWSQMTSMRRH